LTRFRTKKPFDLTRMSGSNRPPEVGNSPNSMKLRRLPRVARPLLRLMVMAAWSAAWLAAPVVLTGCPIPPPLETDLVDAAPDSPQVILSASPEDFAIPGPIVLDRGDPRRMTLTVQARPGETSYVYFYRNYFQDSPTPSIGDCRATEDTSERIVDCGISTFCAGLSDTDDAVYLLEAVVANTEKLGEGEPAFRAFPAGVTFTRVSWLMTCNPPEVP
jgi:hypothetical protein